MRLLEVHIEVEDIQRSLDFYKSIIPHNKITDWKDRSAAAIILNDGTAFGLWQKGKRGLFDGRGGEHVHFAFQIKPDEYSEMIGKLTALKVDYKEHNWPNGQHSVYFFDPDGHQGEIMTCDWHDLSNESK